MLPDEEIGTWTDTLIMELEKRSLRLMTYLLYYTIDYSDDPQLVNEAKKALKHIGYQSNIDAMNPKSFRTIFGKHLFREHEEDADT